jgi:ribosome-binding factor A
MSRHQPKARGHNRNRRLADQIQRDLASMIQREFNVAELGLVTLSRVELSADYAHAKVWFTVMGGEPAKAEAALNERSGYLHSLLYKQLHIHTVPRLKFVHDTPISEGIALARLIDEAAAVSRAGAAQQLPPDDPDEPDEPQDPSRAAR